MSHDSLQTRRIVDERSATRRSLISMGLSAEDAASWCAAWEVEAERQHLDSDSPYFWDAGRGWIDAQRSLQERSIPVAPTPGHQAIRPPSFSVVRT